MRRARGFTMVEMIVVIVLVGIIAGAIMMVFRPALEGYLDVGRRANLSHQADAALRRITSEVRAAVPNSLRLMDGTQGIELVPTSDGGRFRTGPDTSWNGRNSANPSRFVDGAQAATVFDVVTRLDAGTARGDFVVIGNLAPDDIHGGTSIAAIDAVADSPSDALGSPGLRRITLAAANRAGTAFQPFGVDSGRFVVVSDAVQAVTYRCEGAGLDAAGSGAGVLVRYHGYGMGIARPALPGGTGRHIVASHVASCQFRYEANLGVTQQSGFLQVQLTLADHGEQVTLTHGAQVNNVP